MFWNPKYAFVGSLIGPSDADKRNLSTGKNSDAVSPFPVGAACPLRSPEPLKKAAWPASVPMPTPSAAGAWFAFGIEPDVIINLFVIGASSISAPEPEIIDENPGGPK